MDIIIIRLHVVVPTEHFLEFIEDVCGQDVKRETLPAVYNVEPSAEWPGTTQSESI